MTQFIQLLNIPRPTQVQNVASRDLMNLGTYLGLGVGGMKSLHLLPVLLLQPCNGSPASPQ